MNTHSQNPIPYIPGLSEKFGITVASSRDDIAYKSYIDYELFYIYLADVMMTYPKVVAFVEDEYDKNKYLYYSKAIGSTQYYATIMSDSSIAQEVMTKRAFGILLAARDNSSLQAKICEVFISAIPVLRKLKKPFTIEEYTKLDMEYMQTLSYHVRDPYAARAFRFFAPYVVDYYIGLSSKNRGAALAKVVLISEIIDNEVANQQGFTKRVEAVNIRNYVRTPAAFREFKPLIENGRDLYDAMSITIDITKAETKEECLHNERFSSLYEYLSRTENNSEQIKIRKILSIIQNSCRLAGKESTMLLWKQELTENEISLLYKIVAESTRLETNGLRLADIQPSDCVLALTIYQIIKAMQTDRDFYYKNSAETQFLEMRMAEKENAALKEQISIQQQEIEDLKHKLALATAQNNALRNELTKDEKDAAKPLLAEISMLNGQVADLQQKMEAEETKRNELNKLREFVFELQSVGDIPEESLPISSLIKNKKIYIFGGHINWRNKIKQKYPSLEVLDGHNTSFDEKYLLGADMVLMNTSNMSHALYYKIIDVLRKNNIPFDYLGKYSNPNLLEREIGEALLRQKQ